MSQPDEWPIVCAAPEPGEFVQVLMTREMAQRFAERCLGVNTAGGTAHLVGPLLFSADDLPTYIIGV